MFNYGFMQAHIQGFLLLGIYMLTNKVPFIYDSWRLYVEILIASLANIAGLSMILVAY